MVQIQGKHVGETGYGLMGLTWRPQPCSREQAFGAMRTALACGANFWNGGELYLGPRGNSLDLLREYFTKYPEDADKVVLSIKGGVDVKSHVPDGSEQNVRKSVENCVRQLAGTKKIDLFECARVDPNTPIETTVAALKKLQDEGKIGGISLSEVSAKTIERASKVAKISAVEVEMSLWSTDFLENGVTETCAKLGIPIIAYSPLGRGFLTGELKKPEDIPEGDFRRFLPRFQPGAFEKNLILVKEIQELAEKKGCMPSQLALAWVRQTGQKEGMPAILPIPGATTDARIKENSTVVKLTPEEFAAVDELAKSASVTGGRYAAEHSALLAM